VIAVSRRTLRLAALVVAVCATGCIIPFATPPLRGEIGGGTRVGREDERNSTSLHAAVGTHIASGTTDAKFPFDIGAGWTMEKTKDTFSNGFYMDGSYFIDAKGSHRTSIGARGEMRWIEEGKAAAAKLRIDTEWFSAGTDDFTGDSKCGTTAGTHVGTSAFGFFVEAGRVWTSDVMTTGGDAWVATAGVTVRLPSSYGVYVGIPWCK